WMSMSASAIVAGRIRYSSLDDARDDPEPVEGSVDTIRELYSAYDGCRSDAQGSGTARPLRKGRDEERSAAAERRAAVHAVPRLWRMRTNTAARRHHRRVGDYRRAL